jgi:hypothetical protein
MSHMFFLSRKYDYLSIAQISPLRPSLRNFATKSESFRFSVNFFSWSHLAVGPKNIFHRGPNPLSAAVMQVITNVSGETDSLISLLKFQISDLFIEFREHSVGCCLLSPG